MNREAKAQGKKIEDIGLRVMIWIGLVDDKIVYLKYFWNNHMSFWNTSHSDCLVDWVIIQKIGFIFFLSYFILSLPYMSTETLNVNIISRALAI